MAAGSGVLEIERDLAGNGESFDLDPDRALGTFDGEGLPQRHRPPRH